MQRVRPVRMSATETAAVWVRWRRGGSISEIGRAMDRSPGSIFYQLATHGGISPVPRTRSWRALTLHDREEISRGLASGRSLRAISAGLGRAPSTISREVQRHGGRAQYRVKPTTRLNQVVIQPFPTGVASLPGLRYVIATRQIYANHYFSATLELRTLVDDDDGEDDGFFLLYATRSRVTGLSGFFKGLLRVIVKRRARSGMERYLTNTQAVIEGRSPGGH